MKNKLFWLILTLSLAGLIGLFALTNQGSDNQVQPAGDIQTVVADDHIRGNAEAPHTLIEYGDLQCPACASMQPIVNRLIEDMPSEVRLVFRHFPLPGHTNAFAGARAAEAAGAQGKFFEMADLLYERQNQWSSSTNVLNQFFRNYAQELGLDGEKFNADYNSQATTSRINRDITSGNELGVSSTPTFYLDGKPIQSSANYETFRRTVEEAMQP